MAEQLPLLKRIGLMVDIAMQGSPSDERLLYIAGSAVARVSEPPPKFHVGPPIRYWPIIMNCSKKS